MAAAGLVVLALALAGCASLGGGAQDAGGLPDGDRGDGHGGDGGAGGDDTAEVLVRVAHHGAFAPLGWDFSSVAELTVYADGLAVTPGPTTLEHPGRLLPNLRTHRLSDEQLEAIIGAATDAGLLDEAPDYGRPPITDVGSTLVTITVDGATYEHDAYALSVAIAEGMGEDSGLTSEQLAAREALDGFLTTARSQVEAAGDDGAYEPEAFAVMARPTGQADVAEPADGVVVPAEIPWPLADVALADCVVVAGDDAAALLPVLEGARQGDRFVQDGVVHDVWVRVLLPGDPGCTGDETAPAHG